MKVTTLARPNFLQVPSRPDPRAGLRGPNFCATTTYIYTVWPRRMLFLTRDLFVVADILVQF